MENVGTVELLTRTFSNDPIVFFKWVLVFAAFIMTFVVRIKFKIDEKLDPSKRLDKKVQKAIENNHVINAKLLRSSYSFDDDDRQTYSGTYEYEINGKKRKYSAYFGEGEPVDVLHLYYKDTPRRLFTNEVYHHYTITGLPLVILNFSPFIVAGLMVLLLGLQD